MPSNWAPTTSRGRARPQENDNVNHVVALSRNIYSILPNMRMTDLGGEEIMKDMSAMQ